MIQAGNILEAISLVNELHPQLLDNDRYLLFHLQQQHLIELIRQQKVEEALQYAAEHLAERGEEDGGVLQELERTLALLAFEDPAKSPFSDLLQPAHRQQVLTLQIIFIYNQEIFLSGCQSVECCNIKS